MKIESVELYHVRMPLLEPWRTAYGSDAAIESVLLRIRSGGVEGWGESSPLAKPCYSPEWAGGIFAVLRDCLIPRVLGETFSTGEALQERLSLFKGNPFAKAALDTAWWDLKAQAEGVPLYRLLGGHREAVAAGADFGICDSVGQLIERVGGALASGAPRVKLKFSRDWGLPVATAVREAFPDAVLHIDCNAGFTLEDQFLFEELDSLGLAMFEQPLAYNDVADHAALQRTVLTPICLDESVNSLHSLEQALSLGSCRWVNVKPGRVGGLTVARQIHDRCAEKGIPCWVGGMLESAVGARHCAALATLPNFKYPADLFPTSRFYAEDLAEPAVAFETPWTIRLPKAAGIGTRPEPERLRRWSVQSAIF